MHVCTCKYCMHVCTCRYCTIYIRMYCSVQYVHTYIGRYAVQWYHHHTYSTHISTNAHNYPLPPLPSPPPPSCRNAHIGCRSTHFTFPCLKVHTTHSWLHQGAPSTRQGAPTPNEHHKGYHKNHTQAHTFHSGRQSPNPSRATHLLQCTAPRQITSQSLASLVNQTLPTLCPITMSIHTMHVCVYSYTL